MSITVIQAQNSALRDHNRAAGLLISQLRIHLTKILYGVEVRRDSWLRLAKRLAAHEDGGYQ